MILLAISPQTISISVKDKKYGMRVICQLIPQVFGYNLTKLASILFVLKMIRTFGFWQTAKIAKTFNAAWDSGTLKPL